MIIGSRAAGCREPRQIRKEAAVSGFVPGVAGAPDLSWLCVFRPEGIIRSRRRGKIIFLKKKPSYLHWQLGFFHACFWCLPFIGLYNCI